MQPWVNSHNVPNNRSYRFAAINKKIGNATKTTVEKNEKTYADVVSGDNTS